MSAARCTLIGLAGTAGAGKDTAGEHLWRRHGFYRYAFALPLRAMLNAMLQGTGIDVAWWMEQRAAKELPIPGVEHSYRRLAQTLGTEWGRALDPDLWLRVAALRLGLPDSPRSPRVVITDVRMPNEVAWIHALGGQVWRLDRRQAPPVADHVSEALVDSLEIDGAIDNSGSYRELFDALDFQVGTL